MSKFSKVRNEVNSLSTDQKEKLANYVEGKTGRLCHNTDGSVNVTSLVIGLIFIAYLVPLGLRELANANLTGVDATQTSLFGLIGLMVVLGLVKRFSNSAE